MPDSELDRLTAQLDSLTLDVGNTCHPIKFYPTPGDENFEAHSSAKEKYFYVVSKGLEPGIYTRWLPANAQLREVNGATHWRVNTYNDAVHKWNSVHVCQCSSSTDTPRASKSVTALQCPDKLRDTCDPNLKFYPMPGDEDFKNRSLRKKENLYVVWEGRKPGIYTRWTSGPENSDVSASFQVQGVLNSHQKVKTWDEAENLWRHTCILMHGSPCNLPNSQALPALVPTRYRRRKTGDSQRSQR